MLKLCPEFSLSDAISTQEELDLLLKSATPTVIEILNSACFVESQSTRQITTLQWPQGVHYISYRSKDCLANLQDIESVIEDDYRDAPKMIKSVNVRKFDL